MFIVFCVFICACFSWFVNAFCVCVAPSNVTKAIKEGAFEVVLRVLKDSPDNIMNAYLSLKVLRKLLTYLNSKIITRTAHQSNALFSLLYFLCV